MTDLADWNWWFGPWRSLIRCTCGALTHPHANCPVCNRDWASTTHTIRDPSGHLRPIPAAMMGAIDWSDYVLLKMMHVEWQRPIGHSDTLQGLPDKRRPSPRL